MRLLLDSHALIWLLGGDNRLSHVARQAITRDADATYVSAASAWEITTKHRLGKLPEAAMLARNFEPTIVRAALHPLSVTMQHADLAGNLTMPHKDPFDRMLIAQALIEGLRFVSNEARFDAFGVSRIW